MDLILWRHCDAEPGEPDLARRLTAKGTDQAQRMAQWLAPRLPLPCRIVVSPAVRTQQTARALGRTFETSADMAPGASAEAVLDAAGWPDAGTPVLIVGHQPTLGDVAARLMARRARGWHVRKGAVWWITDRDGHEDPSIKLVMSPDLT